MIVGAVITSVLFNIGKSLIAWYIGSSAIASSYGAAGGLIVLFWWVYYSVQIFLFGAEFTKIYANRHGSKQRKFSYLVEHLIPLFGKRKADFETDDRFNLAIMSAIGTKQTIRPCLCLSAIGPKRTFDSDKSMSGFGRKSGHRRECPLLGVKRTWRLRCEMSASDPKRGVGATSPVARASLRARRTYFICALWERDRMSFDVGPSGNRNRNAFSNNYGSTQNAETAMNSAWGRIAIGRRKMMRGTIRKSMIAATALLVIAGTTMALPNAASARWGGGWHGGGWHGGGWRGGGWGWGGVGLGIGTGLLLAAAASAPYYGGYGYYDNPYSYGYAPVYGYGPYGYGYRRAYYGYGGYYPRYRYAGYYPYRRHYYRYGADYPYRGYAYR